MRARILTVAAASGALTLVAAADIASAETLNHLRMELYKSKVPEGSIPGHPDQNIAKRPPPPVVTIHREPNPDEPGYVAPRSRGTVHHYGAPSCHDDVCESE